MTEDILKTLESLGFSKNEAKIYVTLLDIGPATATDISQRSKLHRPNVYDSLTSLSEKGLVSFTVENNTKLFKAANPEKLMQLVKQKEIDLKKILPRLDLQVHLAKKKENFAEIHQGLKAFRLYLFSLLENDSPIYSFGIPTIVPKILSSFIEIFHAERAKKKKLFVHIYNENAKDRIKHLNTLPYTEAFYLPEKFNSPVTTLVCVPEVWIIRWEPLTFIRIIDESLAKTYENYCKHLVLSSKKD